MVGSRETVRVPPRTHTRRAIERVAVFAFVGCWLFVAGRLLSATLSLGVGTFVIALPTGLLIGVLLADFVAGCVHWVADRFFDVGTPLIGPALIAPFREHHDDATRMAEHDFFEVCGSSAGSTLPLLLILGVLPAPESLLSGTGQLSILALAAALFATNQLHAWAHAPSPPASVRRLQRAGLILSPDRHARHHRGAHDLAYCVTTGWLNPVLDGLRLFPLIESLVATRRTRRARRRGVT